MALTHTQAVRLLNFSATFDSVTPADVQDYMDRIKERFDEGNATIDEVLMFCIDKITKTCAATSYKNVKALLEGTSALVISAAYAAPEKRTYDWNGNTDIEMSRPEISDYEVAGQVRMLMRDELRHEAVCCLARDRIMALSKENTALQAEVDRLSQFDPRDKDGKIKRAVPFVQE
jgi:hypothetical protein